MVMWLYAMTFPNQAKVINPILKHCVRGAIDRTGMGVGLTDLLNLENESRLMGVSFSGSNDQGVRMKTDLAVRLKKNFEKARDYVWRALVHTRQAGGNDAKILGQLSDLNRVSRGESATR